MDMEMMKQNYVRNGGIKLPIGFRFRPTDEELVVHYLKRKANSIPLPASVIPELDAFHFNPWDLPGDSKEKRYFFIKRKRNENKSYRIISSGSGYWKAIGKEKYVVASGSNNQTAAVGMKKTMVFCQRKRPRGGPRTHWIMHEFRLVGPETTTQRSMMEMEEEEEDWVVCSIYQKQKRESRKSGAQNGNNTTRKVLGKIRPSSSNIMDIIVMDFDNGSDSGPPPPPPPQQPSSPSSLSSCSSVITDQVSSKGSDHEEEINQCLHYY